jgi:hypothetical protein
VRLDASQSLEEVSVQVMNALQAHGW